MSHGVSPLDRPTWERCMALLAVSNAAISGPTSAEGPEMPSTPSAASPSSDSIRHLPTHLPQLTPLQLHFSRPQS